MSMTPQERWAKVAGLVEYLMDPAHDQDAAAFKANDKQRILEVLAGHELTLGDVLMASEDIDRIVPEGSPIWKI